MDTKEYSFELSTWLSFECKYPGSCLTEEHYHRLKSLTDLKMSNAFYMHVENLHKQSLAQELNTQPSCQPKNMFGYMFEQEELRMHTNYDNEKTYRGKHDVQIVDVEEKKVLGRPAGHRGHCLLKVLEKCWE